MYQGHLTSHKGIPYTVTISGGTGPLVFSGESPITISRDAEGGIFTPIIPTTATLRLIADSAGQYSELLSSDLICVVIITSKGAPIFRGVIEKGLYEEAYDRPPYAVEITAVCGLKQMQDYTPYLAPPIPTRLSLLDLLKACIRTAGGHVTRLDFALDYCSNLADIDIVTMDWISDATNSDNPTAYDLASSILSSLNARLYQDGNVWIIDRPTDLLSFSIQREKIDTPTTYFIDTAQWQISRLFGALTINLTNKATDNILQKKLPKDIQVQKDSTTIHDHKWFIDATPFEYLFPDEEAERGEPTPLKYPKASPSQKPGLTVRLDDAFDPSVFAEFCYILDIQTIWSNRAHPPYNRLTFYYQLDQDGNTSPGAYYYTYPCIYLLDEHYKVLQSTYPKDGNGVTAFEFRDGFMHEDLARRRTNKQYIATTASSIQNGAKQDIAFCVECPLIDDYFREKGARYLKITLQTAVLNTMSKEPDKVSRYANFLPRLDFGGFRLTLGSTIQEENTEDFPLFLQRHNSNQRQPDEIDCAFRTLLPYAHHPITPMTARTLFQKDTTQAIEYFTSRSQTSPLNYIELMTRDRLQQYSTPHSQVSATLNNANLYSPRALLRLDGRNYLPTAQLCDLLEDQNEITITEIIPNEKHQLKWL